MPIPEWEKASASKLLTQFCETRIPARVRHQIELGFRFEGSVAYLSERRPDWRGSDEWMSMDIASVSAISSARRMGPILERSE